MAEQAEDSIPKGESVSSPDKIEEKPHDLDSSSSDSDSDDEDKLEPSSSSAMDRSFRLFGRQKPVYHVLGGGKSADILLWRNKKISTGVLLVVTVIWILFELLGYHLLTLVSHGLILTLTILFLWSMATTFINKSPPRLPEVSIPEDLALNVALSLRTEVNRGFNILKDIVSGHDLKKFLAVIAGLWILSIIGSSVSFLTLFYIVFVLLHTVPVLYEKYDDKVDFYLEKAMAEIEMHHAVIRAKVVSKSRAVQTKLKKQQ
ncbi:Reticulon-like protein B3 [Platanthera guangdongensis]|uniref:Reticulon-like protein n=1 Tax=Platanthera guangdongensis TaxID=2320717 RepID=A0ABR2M2A7_9ASPA